MSGSAPRRDDAAGPDAEERGNWGTAILSTALVSVVSWEQSA